MIIDSQNFALLLWEDPVISKEVIKRGYESLKYATTYQVYKVPVEYPRLFFKSQYSDPAINMSVAKSVVIDIMERQVTMAIFGKNGFIWKQEVRFAKKLLVWQYEKSGAALPDETAISAHAQKIVEDAHVIAKKSGSTVLETLKKMVKDIKK